MDPATAIRKQIAQNKRDLLRLQRALEIVTGKRGIEGAPADGEGKPSKLPKPKPVPYEQKAHRAPGELEEDIRTAMADGEERTIPEIAAAVGKAKPHMFSHPTHFYTPLKRMADMLMTGKNPITYRLNSKSEKRRREAVTTPGVGVREGRLV